MTAMAALGLVRARRLARDGGPRVRALARGAPGLAHELHARRAPLATAEGAGRGRGQRVEAARGVGDHRVPSLVRQGPGRVLAPLRAAGARRLPRPARYVEATVAVELNAATDNPLVLVEEGEIVSAGNFHGQPVAFALDALAMAAAELASISERRTERLVNPSLSDGLPPFLVEEGGSNSGFMIPQYVAAALVSENKVLAHPASVDSIPTSAGQEDHVSMGNAAGLKALQVLDNAERALAIELLAGAQAIEFLAPLRPGEGVRAVHDLVRTLSERLVEDRSLSADIERVADAIRSGAAGGGRARDRGARVSRTASLDGARRLALRRPLEDLGAPGAAAHRALVADGGAAADAAQQPRPRGRRAPRGARRLRRDRQGGAQPRGLEGDRPDALAARATTRRSSSRAASRSVSSARPSGRRGCSSRTRSSCRAGRRGTSSAGSRPRG